MDAERPLRRRRQADDREQPLPGPGRRGGPLGRPALQGERRAKIELDHVRGRRGHGGHRAGDPARSRRLSMVGARRRSGSSPASSTTSASPTRCSSTTTGSRSSSRASWSSDRSRRGTSHGLRQEAVTRGSSTAVPRPGDRDERPPGDHRRDLRGVADVPVEPGGLHDVLAGQGLHPEGAEDPLLHPGQGRAGPRPRRTVAGRSAGRPDWGPDRRDDSPGRRSTIT